MGVAGHAFLPNSFCALTFKLQGFVARPNFYGASLFANVTTEATERLPHRCQPRYDMFSGLAKVCTWPLIAVAPSVKIIRKHFYFCNASVRVFDTHMHAVPSYRAAVKRRLMKHNRPKGVIVFETS
jgi:hypothetical protein